MPRITDSPHPVLWGRRIRLSLYSLGVILVVVTVLFLPGTSQVLAQATQLHPEVYSELAFVPSKNLTLPVPVKAATPVAYEISNHTTATADYNVTVRVTENDTVLSTTTTRIHVKAGSRLRQSATIIPQVHKSALNLTVSIAEKPVHISLTTTSL
ncbi:MAG TPA: hypothetical protein VI322_00755 [Candidatus Saccharimonadia bacterium]